MLAGDEFVEPLAQMHDLYPEASRMILQHSLQDEGEAHRPAVARCVLNGAPVLNTKGPGHNLKLSNDWGGKPPPISATKLATRK